MKTINKYWWIIAIQGVFLAGIGAMALINTTVSLKELVQYLGLILLGFGTILSLLALRSRKKGSPWRITLFMGIFQIAIGLFILANPSSSSDVFKVIIGGWALVMTVAQLIIGLLSKNNKIIFFINTVISAAFGSLIIWYNFNDVRALTVLVGIYTAILGFTLIYYAIRLKLWSGQKLKTTVEPVPNIEEKNDKPEG